MFTMGLQLFDNDSFIQPGIMISANIEHDRNRRDFMAKTAVTAVGASLVAAQPTSAASPDEVLEADYVVVGAGSSGCVIANRLSANAETSVMLVEAGGPDRSSLLHHFSRCGELQGSKFDWQYTTEPEPELNGRQIPWPRGKVYGGSSSINYMIYIRGHRLDYDHWKGLGNDGWAYNDLLPYFIKSEHNEHYADQFHGQSGELNVAEAPSRNAMGPAFLDAVRQSGIKSDPNWDFNGATQENCAGHYQHTVVDGKRCSSAKAFLTPILNERRNLTARPWSTATRILLEGPKAIGLEYVDQNDGSVHQVRAKREVIICSGAVDSPQLLMLSGIGPADHLRSHGIKVAVDLPGVGENLRDHPFVPCPYHATIAPDKGAIPCGGLFVHSSNAPKSLPPDLQFHPYSYRDPSGALMFDFIPTLVRPQSVGRISLASNRPTDAPKIQANYLTDPQERRALADGLRLARQFADSAAMKGILVKEHESIHGKKSDNEIEQLIRQSASTLYHPVGTCKMGMDAMSVVDPQLRVRGISGLRVADASIMPTIINGNTNAPCIMIGEKAAHMISQG